jgi:hypothetical protein
VDFSFYYEKMGIDSAAELIDPDNALIGGQVNFSFKGAVISYIVDVTYEPQDGDNWIMTSRLVAGVRF